MNTVVDLDIGQLPGVAALPGLVDRFGVLVSAVHEEARATRPVTRRLTRTTLAKAISQVTRLSRYTCATR